MGTAAIALAAAVLGALAAVPAYATVSGQNGPIAYIDTRGDIATVNSNGTGGHVLVPASSLPGYSLAVAGSGAWSSGLDPELLFLAQSTAVCFDTGCAATPQVRLYRVPESGGTPALVADDLGYIQSASWYGTSTTEIIVSADNGTTDQDGNQFFSLDELSASSPGRYSQLPLGGFDVDATSRIGYIAFAYGNNSYIPPASASPDGPWQGCTTNFSTGLRQCTYQSGPTPPCGGPGYSTYPCPTAPTTTADYPLDTGIYLYKPGANLITYKAPGTGYDYGVTVDPANNVTTFVAELGLGHTATWFKANTYEGSAIVQSAGSTAPGIRWTWSPNGQQIAQSSNGKLSVYNASNLNAGEHVIASGLAPSPAFPSGSLYPELRNAGSAIAWATPRPYFPPLPSKHLPVPIRKLASS
ncbi:MAG: hypothetical protein ACLP01_11765 [Solirubrobacteraceae bacterium]